MRRRTPRNAPSLLDVAERGYEDRAADLCRRAGLTGDDLRMRMDRTTCQTARIHVWRQIEREGRPS